MYSKGAIIDNAFAPFYLFIYWFIPLLIYLFLCWFIYLFIYLVIYLFIHLIIYFSFYHWLFCTVNHLMHIVPKWSGTL